MVEQITEKFRHHSINETVHTPHNTYRASSCRADTWSPIVDRSLQISSECRRSIDESGSGSGASNVFSVFRQSRTPPTRSLETPTFLQQRRYTDGACPLCELAGNLPPSSKRHCRSLSIPNGVSVSRATCQHVAANLYRPVAVRPSSCKGKNRNSPLNYTKSSNSISVTSPGVLRSSSEFSSPPDSPVPRPASVSSGYYDSSMSSLGAPWLEQHQFSPSTVFQKSLSMEESISRPVLGFVNVVYAPAGSTPTSPRRQRITRCRSQPCVVDRKSGVKRRREEVERPTLDFLKMKETAYHHFRRPRAYTHPKDIRSPRTQVTMLTDEDKIFGLNTILGSPLDSHMPALKSASIAVSPSTSPTKEVDEVDEEVEEINFKLSDSGCSDTGCDTAFDSTRYDPPRLVDLVDEFPTADDYAPTTPQRLDDIFHIDELDLEQIEND